MTPLKLTVIGCGYLGAVHAAAMAHLGHHVLGIDTRPEQVEALSQGRAPFYEPGLPELLVTGARQGDLRFTSTPTPAELAEADVHFIAVGTPQSATGGEADLSQLWSVVDMLHDALPEGGRSLVVGKSTVPVGTAQQVAERLAGRALVLWNPEFLREGFAVADTLHPDRIVYGVPTDPADAQEAQAVLDAVYQDLLEEGIPRIVTDYPTAELVKTAANSFLATKISFINAMAHLCDTAGADVTVLADAIGHDPRIGRRFLQAGVGFGGGCLPKDIRAFRDRAADLGVGEALDFLADVDAVNDSQRTRAVRTVRDLLGGLAGRRIAVLGAAFKPDSDDVRTSPGLLIAAELEAGGASVAVTDPAAGPALKAHGGHAGEFVAGVQDAVAGADAVLLATEWEEYRRLDPARLAGLVRRRVVFDGRNALDPARWKAAGWTYRGVGRR